MYNFRAEIPTHHTSTHRSERAAKVALADAERASGVTGTVTLICQSGSYRSATPIWPWVGDTYCSSR